MKQHTILRGFSKLSAKEKLLLAAARCENPREAARLLQTFVHPDSNTQSILSGISENTIANYPLPYNIAPNFLINGKMYMVPMVTEESSVVAAASSAASFWAERGGFRTRVRNTIKNGQVHFLFTGDESKLRTAMPALESFIRDQAKGVTRNMEKRGGGVNDISLRDCRHLLDNYYQLDVRFDTRDAMGANFINSCLEAFSEGMHLFFEQTEGFDQRWFEPLMAILSNYNDECIVEAVASCDLNSLSGAAKGLTAGSFARRFEMAVRIAEMDVHRATTHNKGIMNGVDAVVLATGNDFRAIEAGAHAWAARSGQYRSLSTADVSDNSFSFSLEMPMALGTTGGLTRLHPLAALSLEILGNPGGEELMTIAACAGLANNFAAVRSLTTTGIQSGHMRMHLSNILLQLKARPEEAERIKAYFQDKKVSYQAVAGYLETIRNQGKKGL